MGQAFSVLEEHVQISSNNINFAGRDDRQNGAWTITSDRWRSHNGYLVLPINPENLEISKRIRGGEVSMQGGKFITVSRRTRGASVYEYPIISFKFNSGNIQPVFSDSFIRNVQQYGSSSLNVTNKFSGDSIKPNIKNVGDHRYGVFRNVKVGDVNGMPNGLYLDSIPVGVQNLYALLNLVNDSWMLDTVENGKDRSVLNRILVNTNSLALPSITFYGFVDEAGIQWSESVDNFNNFETTFNLVVTHTRPLLNGNQLDSLVRAYKANIYVPRATEISNPGGTCREESQDPMPDPISPTAPEEPLVPLTLADKIRAKVATKVNGAKQAVDNYAEKAKVRVDEQYAQQKALADFQKSFADTQFDNQGVSDVETKTTDLGFS